MTVLVCVPPPQLLTEHAPHAPVLHVIVLGGRGHAMPVLHFCVVAVQPPAPQSHLAMSTGIMLPLEVHHA